MEVRKGHAEVHAPEPGRHDLDESLRSGVRQRFEQQGVDRAEDGGVGPDAEREREHCHRGEGGALGEGADGVTHVLKESVHHSARNASSGEMELARSAGITDAASADNPSITTAASITMGSYGLTP